MDICVEPSFIILKIQHFVSFFQSFPAGSPGKDHKMFKVKLHLRQSSYKSMAESVDVFVSKLLKTNVH